MLVKINHSNLIKLPKKLLLIKTLLDGKLKEENSHLRQMM